MAKKILISRENPDGYWVGEKIYYRLCYECGGHNWEITKTWYGTKKINQNKSCIWCNEHGKVIDWKRTWAYNNE